MDGASTQATGSVSRRITIDETGGSKLIAIRVRAEDATREDYTLTVSRDESSNACLSSLELISKDPMSNNIRDNLPCNERSNGRSIEFSVQNTITEVVLRPTAAGENATIKVFAPDDTAGEVIASGGESRRSIPIPEGGAVTARIEVSAQDSSTRHYQVLINRGDSSDANLKDLQLLGENREQLLTFSDNQEHYDVDVPNTIMDATMIATAHDKATIELNIEDEDASSTGEISRELELEPGIAKQIRIVITSQDESTTRAYTVRVTRTEQDDSNAELGSIGLSILGSKRRLIMLPPAMKVSNDATTYTATIRDIAERRDNERREVQNITEVIVSPRAADSGATISVNGGPASSDAHLDFDLTDADLDQANTPITIKVIAADGMTSQTYSLIITRESSADTSLGFLEVGNEALTIDDEQERYEATIDEHTTNTIVTVNTIHSQARVTISGGGGSDVSGIQNANKKINFAGTGNSQVITITVHAQNSTISKVYTLTVTRDQSSDVQLANIRVAGIPAVAAIESPTAFTATVGENVAMPAVIVNASHSQALVTIREAGSSDVSNIQSASKAISIANPGDSRVISIVVTAQNGMMEEYTLTVTRARSSDAHLNKLELLLQPSGAAEVIFDSISSTQSYALRVDNAVTSVKVKPTANSDYAYKMEVFAPDNDAGEQIVAGGESSEIPLIKGGFTEIKIMVTAQDEVTTRGYIVRVTRALSSDANLSTLSVLPSTLEPPFASDVRSYTVREDIIESFVLTVGAKANQAVTIALNYAVPDLLIASNAESRSASQSIDLEYGRNTLTIEVTAADERSNKTYIVTAFRPIFLNSLSLTGLKSDDPFVFDRNIEHYTVTIANESPALGVEAAVVADDNLSYTIFDGNFDDNNEITQDSSGIASILFDAGETKTITIVVAAQDGTTKSYTVQGTREISRDASLGTLQLLPEALGFSFDPARVLHTLNIPNPVVGDKTTSIRLKAAGTHREAMITMFTVNAVARGGVSADKNSIDADIFVDEGETKRIIIEVTAQDDETTKSYTVRLTRDASSDIRLRALTVEPDRVPQGFIFNPTTDTHTIRSYSIELPSNMANTTVTATANNENARLTIRESTGRAGPPSRSASFAVMIAEGDSKDIIIEVTAQNGTTETYSMIISRASSNTNLKAQPDGFSVSEGTVRYDETNLIYRVDVENNVESIQITLMPQDTDVVEIALDGTPLDLRSLKQTGEVSTVITDLIVGNNIKILMITAQDTETSQSYTLIVNRARSADDRIDRMGFEFSLFAGESSERTVAPKSFNPETLMYTLPDVEEEINRVKATLMSSHNDAKIEIRKSGGSYRPVVSGMQSDFINLSLGENIIEIKVTAPNEITSRVYTVKMTRNLSTNTDLSEAPRVESNLESNLASREAESDDYVITIDTNTRNFTVAATAAHSSATVMISGGGGSDVSGSPSATKENISISREIAPVTITIVVLSQSNRNRQTYNLRINLALSSETRLASLTAGATTLTVVENQTAYTASIGEEIRETTVTAVAKDDRALVRITVDGASTQATGSVSRRITIDETGTSKLIAIRVRAEDTTTVGDYTLTVSRDESSNACLSSLELISKDPMSNNIEDNLPCNERSIEFSVQNTITEVVLRPTAADENATIKVFAPGDTAGEVIARDGESSRPIPIPEGGAVTARIEVTAQDSSTRHYQVRIYRDTSSDANLKGLQLLGENGEQLLTFIDNQEHYEVRVPNTIMNATVMVTAHDKATIELILDGTSSTSTGVIRGELGLVPGIAKQIRIVITSQNESTTRAYTVRVTRAIQDDRNAELRSIGLSVQVNNRVISLPPAVKGSDDAIYTAAIGDIEEFEVQETTRVRVSPRAADSGATISIDDGSASLNPSLDFSLTAELDTEERAISIKVIAADGMTSRTYSLVITRESSADTSLEELKVDNKTLEEIEDGEFNYEVSIGEDTENTTVTVTARHSQALVTISGNGPDVSGTGSASKPISLATGESKELKIVVTAQDRTTTRSYTVRVTRDQSTNVQLANITVAGSELMQDSDDDTRYTATISEDMMNTTVTVTARHPQALVTIKEMNEDDVGGNAQNASKPISLATGESKELKIVVTAQDRTTTRGYTVQVTRALSLDANLSALSVVSSTLVPPFDPDTRSYAVRDAIIGSFVELMVDAKANQAVTIALNDAVPELLIASNAESRSALRRIDLEYGENTLTIEVTAQDGETTRSYTVLLTRLASSDIRLSALTVEPDGVPQGFIFNPTTDTHAIRSYSIELPSTMANTTVTATANNENARLTIRESTGEAGSPSRSASLAVMVTEGDRKDITIEVTAQNGTTETYRVIISRASAMDRSTLGFEAELSGVTLTADILTSYTGTRIDSSSDNTIASASVDVGGVSVERIWVDDDTETNYILGGTAQSLTADAAAAVISRAIPLPARKIILVLRRTDNTEDGYTEASYTINIEAPDEQSSDTSLASLTAGATILTVVENQTAYTASIGEEVSETTVTAVARDSRAVVIIMVDDVSTEAIGSVSRRIAIDGTGTSKLIDIRVRAEDNTFGDYTLTVNRDASSDTSLESLEVGSEAFEEIEDGEFNYEVRIGEDTENTIVTVTARHSQALVTISSRGDLDVGGNAQSASKPISLATGESKELRIVVTAQDRTTTRSYTVRVTRDQSSNVQLANITVAGSELMQDSDDDTRYTATIGEDTENTTVTVTARHSQALVTISGNGPDVSGTGSASKPISLATGESKELKIVVTAQDRTTTRSYTVRVTRDQSSDVQLANITVAGSELMQDSDDDTRYTATISEDMMNTTVTVTARHPQALVTIKEMNEDDVGGNAQNASKPISLATGESKELKIVVTAQDRTTTRGYTVQVTRALSSDANLSALSVVSSTLVPPFDPDTRSYAVRDAIIGSFVELMVDAKANQAVTIALNDAVPELLIASNAESRSALRRIDLEYGENTLTIEVTAQDGETTRSYTVLLTRLASSDIRLSALTVEPDGVPQGFIFNPTTDTHAIRSYSIELPSTMANTTVTATANNENARLTIRESTGEAGSPSRSASLAVMVTEGDRKDITIEVTAQNGTTETYRVIISRASAMDRSTLGFEAELSGVTLTADTLTSYTVTRIDSSSDNTIASASVDVGGVSVERIWVDDDTETNYILGGTAQSLTADAAAAVISRAIPLPARKIILVLRRTDNTEDGYTEASYTINIEAPDEQSSDTSLASLTAGATILTVVENQTAYTASIGEEVSETTVTAVARDSRAVVIIMVDDVSTEAIGSVSRRIAIDGTGTSKLIDIRVRAEDDTFGDYTLTVNRDASSDTSLESLEVGSEAFEEIEDGEFNYEVRIGKDTENTIVTVTARHPQALVTISSRGDLDVGGNAQSASKPISLATGESKELRIVVTAQDETTRGYTVRVTRDQSSNACLSSLTVNDDILEDDLGCDESGATLVTVNIDNSISEVVFQPTAANDKATIKVGSETIVSDERSETSIPVPEGGSVEVEIEVTAQDGSTHKYTITINRAGSSDADLKNLQLLGTSREELLEFDSDTLSYEVNVFNTVTTATMIATTHENAMIELILDGTSSTSTGVIRSELGLDPEIAKQIRIIITSQDESTTRAYTVSVTRAGQDESNAGLGSIGISVDGSSILLTAIPDNEDATMYTAAISDIGELEVQDIENVRVLPVAADSLATISIDDGSASPNPSLDFSLTAELDAEERAIPIKVIAADGMTSRTYSLVITRESSADTSLEELKVDNKTLEEIEDGEFNYEVSIGEDTENTTVTVTARHSQALVTISGNGPDVSGTGSASKPISLATGESKELKIVVTAQDRTTTRSYTVRVTRDQSSNVQLANITVEGSELMQDSNDDTRYTATIGEDTMNTTVTATAQHPQALVTIKEMDEDDVGGNAQSASKPISLATGESKELKIVVTAQDRTTRSYTVRVTRDQSSNVQLANITVAGSELMQDSDDDTRYTATIGEDTMNTTVTATARHPQALVTIKEMDEDDVGGNAQSASKPISLATGESKELTIRVTAQDDTFKDYKLTVTRTASSNACLNSLWLRVGLGNDDILENDLGCDESGATSVTIDIKNSISEVIFQPTAADDKATIKVGSEMVLSGENSATAIPVPEGGSVEVEIEVTAQDGSTHKYTITINRAASSVADLKNLQLLGTNGEVFLNSTDSKTLSYEVNVFNTVTTTTMIATAHEKAVIELILDDTSSISTGVISGELGLEPGRAKQIRIVITSQDESTTRAYTVRVTRAGQDESNAELGSIGISVPMVGSSILLTAIPDNEDATMYTAAISDIGELEVQNIERVRVLPIAADSLATISIDDGSASPNPSLNFSLAAALDVGNEPIPIKVIAGDGTTSQTYSLVITRESSADTRLRSLGVGSQALTIDDEQERYEATIGEHTTSTTVTVNTKHSQALVTISGGDGSDVSGTESASKNISFAETGHSQVITITVRAQNGIISQVYTLTVIRDQSSNASLGTLQLLPEALGFSFNPENVQHILNIPNPVVGDKTMSIRLQAAGAHSNAIITLFTVDTDAGEGVSENKNEIDAAIPVDEGETKRIIIEVTAQDGETTRSYTVLLTRSASSDIRLSALTVEPEGPPQGFIFNPTTDTHAIQSHSIELPSTMANTTVTATANNENARLTIRESTGEAGSPGRSASLAVMVAEGAHKDIIIEVTAQSGTTETYRVIISRASAMDRTTLGFEVELSGFTLTADTLTSYTGTRIDSNADNTIASALVDVDRVRIERIWVDDDTETNYILGGTAQSLTEDAAAAPISSAIPLPARKIILVLRRTDNTEDGYTEASYTINIESSAVRIRTKIFLEGPLR